MAQQQTKHHERPSLGQRWTAFRTNQENKKHTKNSDTSAKEVSSSHSRPKRRNSIVRVDKATTTSTSGSGGGLIVRTSTSTITTSSQRCNNKKYDEIAPRKPTSMPNLKLSRRTRPKGKKSKSGAITTTTTTRKSLSKGKKSKSGATTTTTTTTTSTLQPHLEYEQLRLSQSNKGCRPMLKKSLSVQGLPESEPQKPRSFSRAVSGSLRNLFGDENSRGEKSTFRRGSRSKKKAKLDKEEKQKRQSPARRQIIIRLQ